jgi:energy-converting hydrogenase Eha subunit F
MDSSAFLKRSRVQAEVPTFEEVLAQVGAFILPVASAAAAATALRSTWSPGGPWRS